MDNLLKRNINYNTHNCYNYYYYMTPHTAYRISGARTRKGIDEVRIISTGRWVTVGTGKIKFQ